jgi:hypothetical protein
MDVVRPEHVARLLRTDDPDPVLVVVRGAAEVVPSAALEGPDYRGALRVAGRADLGVDPGAGVSEEETAALARRLNDAVEHLGG